MPNKELPFPGTTNRFIAFYTETEDLARAAIRAGLSYAKARKLYRDEAVRAEIDKRLDKLHNTQALLIARAKLVDVFFLDANLATSVKVGASKGDDRALKLGYQRVGLYRDGEFLGVPDPSKSSHPDGVPMIYRAERTVTRIEQTTDRVEGALPEQPARPQVEILQY